MTVEQLASQKNFAALSASERALVLAEMSEEAYQQLHQLLIETRQLDAKALPPASLRAKLILQMREQRPQPKVAHRWLTAQVPLWQAAAVMLFGVAVVALRKPTVVEKTIAREQIRIDTVFQEKVLWRERVVVKSKVIYQDRKPVWPMAQMPEKLDTIAFTHQDVQIQEWSDTPIGTTLGDTPELMDFFTQGDK